MIKNGKLYTYDSRKEKYVLCGQIVGNTLFRKVNSHHFMKIVQGYGIQETAFQELTEKGIQNIVLKHEETRRAIQAPISRWLEHSKVMDFGNGKQRFLSVKFMDQREKPDIELLLSQTQVSQKPKVEQMKLYL